MYTYTRKSNSYEETIDARNNCILKSFIEHIELGFQHNVNTKSRHRFISSTYIIPIYPVGHIGKLANRWVQ